uniref:Aminotransferase n=1 Tax=Candidatus Aschnera chinzeii TaxID=1485666 RepID=A0AAT9G4B6_9ENTR|nr:MAG: aspartate transaminase [Candidatus Aschnera chinzeii]
MFKNLKYATTDPILGLTEIFNADTRTTKINLGIGVYVNEVGTTPILSSVKKAEKYLIKNENTKNYLNITGTIKFANVTEQLLFGDLDNNNNYIQTVQTPGGTAALHISAILIAKFSNTKTIWISNPSWPNHNTIFNTVGLQIKYYPYYNFNDHKINFIEMLNALENTIPGDIVLLHGCCHNPTGSDLTKEQWNTLSVIVAEKQLIPLFDFAYHGLANNLILDTECIKIFLQKIPNMIIVSSYSKNFSLYNERVGACTIITKNKHQTNKIISQLKLIIRSIYSNPPAHGAAIVSTILSNSSLKEEWIEELSNICNRIKLMRKLFVNTLEKHDIKNTFDFINNENGMFSIIGLSKKQINILRENYGIYLLDSGRLNFAALRESIIEYVVNAIKNVI